MCSNCRGDYTDPDYLVEDTLACDTGHGPDPQPRRRWWQWLWFESEVDTPREPAIPITWREYAKAAAIFVGAMLGTLLFLIALVAWLGG